MTDKDLPEGVRQVLIHGLELCASVLRGDADVFERAEHMWVVCSEHIEIDEEENV